jgi:integrase
MSVPVWLSVVADVASVASLSVTGIVWWQIRDIRRSVMRNARVPEALRDLQKYSDELRQNLKGWPELEREANAVLAKVDSVLINVLPKLVGAERGKIKKPQSLITKRTAFWGGWVRNPMSLVQNKGAMRKVRKARSLTAEQFHALLGELHEPFATMALLGVCLGLRISEVLALRWSDVDWLGSRLNVQRGIVNQRVEDVKTEGSARTFDLAPELLERLKSTKQRAVFSDAEDWIFASPIRLGRLPYSYTGVCCEIERAAGVAHIGHLGTHTFRHTYRSWLDAVGTPVAVQQKMMRHADIRTTMNIYGDVVTDEMSTAGTKVSRLAFQSNGAQAERRAS